MKFARLLGFAAILMLGIVSVFANEDNSSGDISKDIRYVEVRTPFKSIWVNNDDPTGEIIRQTRKGEYLELLQEGVSWHRVKVDGKVGYLESKFVKVVDKKGAPVITFLLYLLVLGGCVFGVVLYVKKQQRLASGATSDTDLDSIPDPDDILDD